MKKRNSRMNPNDIERAVGEVIKGGNSIRGVLELLCLGLKLITVTGNV